MSISYSVYFAVFTRLMPLKALVSASRPCNASSIATEAESGPRVWWTMARPFSFRFRVTGVEDGHSGTHFDGGGRPQRRGTHTDGVGGIQPDQRGCRDP